MGDMGDKLARNPVRSPFLRFHVINCDPLRVVGSLDQLKVLRTKIDEDIREFGGFISRRKRQTQAYLQKTTMSLYIYIWKYGGFLKYRYLQIIHF